MGSLRGLSIALPCPGLGPARRLLDALGRNNASTVCAAPQVASSSKLFSLQLVNSATPNCGGRRNCTRGALLRILRAPRAKTTPKSTPIPAPAPTVAAYSATGGADTWAAVSIASSCAVWYAAVLRYPPAVLRPPRANCPSSMSTGAIDCKCSHVGRSLGIGAVSYTHLTLPTT